MFSIWQWHRTCTSLEYRQFFVLQNHGLVNIKWRYWKIMRKNKNERNKTDGERREAFINCMNGNQNMISIWYSLFFMFEVKENKIVTMKSSFCETHHKTCPSKFFLQTFFHKSVCLEGGSGQKEAFLKLNKKYAGTTKVLFGLWIHGVELMALLRHYPIVHSHTQPIGFGSLKQKKKSPLAFLSHSSLLKFLKAIYHLPNTLLKTPHTS